MHIWKGRQKRKNGNRLWGIRLKYEFGDGKTNGGRKSLYVQDVAANTKKGQIRMHLIQAHKEIENHIISIAHIVHTLI